MKKIVPLERPPQVPQPRAPRPLPVRRPVRAPVPQVQPPLAIEDIAPPQESLWDVLPFTQIEFSCQRIERVGDQTHISQRDMRLENGVVETRRFDGVVDSDVSDELQRQMMYETLGDIFSNLGLAPARAKRRR